MRSLAALFVALAAATAPAADTDKDKDKAKDAAVAFLKAVSAKDLDAVLKAAGTPFLYRDGDKTAALKDEAALKTWMKERLDAVQVTDKLPLKVESVQPFADVRGQITDAAERERFDQAVGKTGFVMVATAPDGKAVPLYVRVVDGKARVVGYGVRIAR